MRIVKNLTFQVIVAIICGIAVGAIWPSVGQEMKPIGETFINMIKMVIAPIIFLTIVLGIASMGSMKKVGRVGGKALLYFEIVTTAALIIGIIVANVVRPGDGLDPSKLKGGGFIVLASTLSAMNVIPLEGLALLLGVDRFMSEARAIVNLIGNGIATVVVAKSENEFDNEKYMKVVEEMKREKMAV
ncbi:hypothetical protein CN907_13340 [Bacillus anthracis]|nr:hypothetical protein CN907_13340 [Bacillus anthracis]